MSGRCGSWKQCSRILSQNINFTSTLIFGQEDVKITSRSYWPSFGFYCRLGRGAQKCSGLRMMQASLCGKRGYEACWWTPHLANRIARNHTFWPIRIRQCNGAWPQKFVIACLIVCSLLRYLIKCEIWSHTFRRFLKMYVNYVYL